MLLKIAIAIIVIAVIIGFIHNHKRSKAINDNGIEVDSAACRRSRNTS